MNASRIAELAKKIEEIDLALLWLNQYGNGLDGHDNGKAAMRIHLNYASACPGAKEAEIMIGMYARTMLPEIIEVTKRACLNDIEVYRDSISWEISE